MKKKTSTGYHSTGRYSTGHHSTGHSSTGNWSTGNYSVGHFSTVDYSGFGVFNGECDIETWDSYKKPKFIYFPLTSWVDHSKMTNQEKIDNVEFVTTGGYLKVLTYKEAWLNAWNGATEEDKELLYALPNFNAEIFKEISGIDVNESSNEMTIEELEKLTGIKNLKIKK